MTRIIFLGTGAGGAVMNKQIRGTGGIILQLDDMQIHLDPGPGSLYKAQELNIQPNHTDLVLISHMHLAHCNDINVLINAMTHSGLERRGVCIGSRSVCASSEGSILTPFHARLLEKIIPFEKNHKVAIGSVEIHALPVQHSDPSAIGFKIITKTGSIGYTGDTTITNELLTALEKTEVLILNVPYYNEVSTGMNLNVKQATEIVRHVQPKIAIITHFGSDIIRNDPLQAARDIQQETKIQTIAAKDGLILTTQGIHKSPVKGYY